MAQRAWMKPGAGRSRAVAVGVVLAIAAVPGAQARPAPAEGLLLPVQGGLTKNPAGPPASAAPPSSPRPPAATTTPAPARPPRPAFALSVADAAGTPPLQPDRPVAVTLRRGQQAFFRVAPEVGEAWAVTTRRLGRDTDTMLAALGEGGAVVAEDDDGGEENLASRIEIQPGDNARLIRAGTLEDAGGRFELVLTREAVLPPPDFATTQADAASRPPLTPGQAMRVRLRRNQQAFFALPEDRADMIAVTRNLSRGTDTVLALLDASGAVLGEDDDGGQELASLLPVTPSPDRAAQGPFTLRAGLVSGGPGVFEVVLEREAPTPPPDYPTTLEQARARGPVAPGQTLRIEMGRNAEAIFALPEGQPLSIATRNLADGADTVLALLDAQGEQIVEDDDGGGGLASRISTAGAPRPATFVRARLLNGARGGFDLVVQPTTSAESASGGTAASLEDAKRQPTLLLGETMRVRLAPDGEAYIALPNDGRPALAMTFDLGPDVDTVLALLDESGAVLTENDDAEGLASRLEVPPSPRPAFLRMKLLDSREGEFSLVLVRPAP